MRKIQNSILYYDGDVTARFDINEANFYPEDVAVCVNGQRQNNVTWSGQGDRWTGMLTISGDGEYIVTMSYTDRSGNPMMDYQSEKIVIDTVAPVIQVNYQNQNVANVIDGVKYYNAAQTATISITDQKLPCRRCGGNSPRSGCGRQSGCGKRLRSIFSKSGELAKKW